MTCEEAMLLLSGHLDGENTQAEEAQLREHLEQCPQCRALLEAMQDADAAVLSLQEEAPADLCSHVMEAIRQEAPKKKHSWKRWTGLAVAAALVLTIGLTAMPQQRQEEAPALMTARSMDEEAAMPRMASYAAAYETAEDRVQRLAEEREAAIVVLQTLPEVLETCTCEELPDGGRLYALQTVQEAYRLQDQYDLELILPCDGGEPAEAYAYLQP